VKSFATSGLTTLPMALRGSASTRRRARGSLYVREMLISPQGKLLPALQGAILDFRSIPRTRRSVNKMSISRWGVYPEQQSETMNSDKHSPIDFLTSALLPIALAVLATMQTDVARFWGFLGLAVVAVSLRFYKTLVGTAREALRRRKERRFVDNSQPHLCHLVARFGEFVDSRNSNTIQEIVRREVCENNTSKVEQLGIARDQIFHDTWYFLNRRVQTNEGSVLSFLISFEEFLSLVNNYVRHCLEPVFERMPASTRSELRPESRVELEAFRERFVSFRDRVEDFSREVSQSLSDAPNKPYIARPKPLSPSELPRSSAG
jgi:hypothetical protein